MNGYKLQPLESRYEMGVSIGILGICIQSFNGGEWLFRNDGPQGKLIAKFTIFLKYQGLKEHPKPVIVFLGIL